MKTGLLIPLRDPISGLVFTLRAGCEERARDGLLWKVQGEHSWGFCDFAADLLDPRRHQFDVLDTLALFFGIQLLKGQRSSHGPRGGAETAPLLSLRLQGEIAKRRITWLIADVLE